MKSLLVLASDTHSQNGEDGVLAEVFRRLAIEKGRFVEFGAWDGKHLSNTFLLAEKGWSGVYIEGDKEKFQAMCENTKHLSGSIRCICAWVQISGDSTLDNLLKTTDLPAEFELLSIDIDSYDYFVWQSLSSYRPIVVVIEINSSYRPHVRHTHKPDAIGSSFRSTLELGIQKGYTLVCHTGNQIFVRSDYVSRLNLPQDELDNPNGLFVDKWVVHVWRSRFARALGRIKRLIT